MSYRSGTDAGTVFPCIILSFDDAQHRFMSAHDGCDLGTVMRSVGTFFKLSLSKIGMNSW